MKKTFLKRLTMLCLLAAASTTFYNCTDETIDDSLESSAAEDRGRARPTEELITETTVTTVITETTLEAEDYSSMSGIQTETSSEGTDNVGWINNGDWLRFDDQTLTDVSAIQARVASNTNGGTIEIRLGSSTGTLIGNLTISNTGGWQTWETLSTNISSTTGVYDVYFVFTGDSGYLFNVNWFEFSIEEDTETETTATGLHTAFAEFNSEAVTVYLSDDQTEYIIETTGLPNHDTVYWGEGNDGYIDEPNVQLTPSIMTSNNNSTTLNVDATPNLTGNTVDTDLSTIGIAVSGSSIFNHEEGNGDLDEAAGSLDWTGAHIGPGVYHYHLEPKAFSNDDDRLVGILKDGVFIYGRKCITTGTYPTDLDESGGHTSATQHNEDGEYHYHIINEIYSTTGSYILFEGPYQGY